MRSFTTSPPPSFFLPQTTTTTKQQLLRGGLLHPDKPPVPSCVITRQLSSSPSLYTIYISSFLFIHVCLLRSHNSRVFHYRTVTPPSLLPLRRGETGGSRVVNTLVLIDERPPGRKLPVGVYVWGYTAFRLALRVAHFFLHAQILEENWPPNFGDLHNFQFEKGRKGNITFQTDKHDRLRQDSNLTVFHRTDALAKRRWQDERVPFYLFPLSYFYVCILLHTTLY